MINLLFIVPRFGTVHRGLETYVKELVSNLDKKKFNITILSGLHNENSEDINFRKFKTLKRENFDWLFKYRITRKYFSFFNIYGSADFEAISLIIQAIKYLRKNNFHYILPFGGFWTYFILNLVINKSFTKVISVGQASVVKKEIIQSDYFIALTPYAYEEACHIINKNKIFLISNGVDITKFKPDNKKITNTILCVAAFSEEKNHISLLNSFSHLPHNIKLILVGNGPLENSLRKHITCITHDIEFKSVTLCEMPAIYKKASIFTLASPEEAFGIVFLEALATGLNVVTHNGERQKYVIGECGFYCNVFDSKEYAKTLLLALNINQKEINIEQARKFSWKSIALEYENFFTRINIDH